MSSLLDLDLEKVYLHIDHFFGIKKNPYVTYPVKMFIFVTKEAIANIKDLEGINFANDAVEELYEEIMAKQINTFDEQFSALLIEMVNSFVEDVETLQNKILDCILTDNEFVDLMRDLTYNTIIGKEKEGIYDLVEIQI